MQMHDFGSSMHSEYENSESDLSPHGILRPALDTLDTPRHEHCASQAYAIHFCTFRARHWISLLTSLATHNECAQIRVRLRSKIDRRVSYDVME